MDAATGIASRAADSFLQEGVLGAVIVVTMLALVATNVVWWMANSRLQSLINKLHTEWREKTEAGTKTIFEALGTVDKTVDVLQRTVEILNSRRPRT